MRFAILVVLLFITTLLTAQEPVLIGDYNPGTEDASDEFNLSSIYLGDDIVFAIGNSATGLEPAILSNGVVTSLGDINPGPAGSSPMFFTLYNNKVYFSARDIENSWAIWSTDGTSSGTELVFDPGTSTSSRPEGLIVSESGYLYFTYGSDLFRFDGEVAENIFSGVSFLIPQSELSPNYGTYGDEIAFVTDESRVIKLYTVQEGEVVLLAEVENASFNVSFYGYSEIDGGLLFGVRDGFSGPLSGAYAYNTALDTLQRLTINSGNVRLLEEFTSTNAIGWVGGQGYYSLNGEPGEEELLFASTNTVSHTLSSASYQGNGIFNVTTGFGGDDFIVYTDGTIDGTTNLYESGPFLSNFITAGKYAFHASKTSNGFEPELYYVDLETGTFNNFYNYDLPSITFSSVIMLGVQNNQLYYFSNLDETVGRELYSIDLNIEVMTDAVDHIAFTHDIRITPSSYEVSSGNISEIIVDVFTTDGRLVERSNGFTNTVYETGHLHGIFVVRFAVGDEVTVRKVLW